MLSFHRKGVKHIKKQYLLDKSGLHSVSEVEFDREEDLEQLICDHPQLLSLNQSNSEIMLVSRQLKLSDGEYKDRFTADILFVNTDGLPILVEVKRHSDTRIRREVVGQMLDYVVCLSEKVNYSDLQSQFKEHYTEDDPIYRDYADNEDFWKRVSENIANGVMSLVFAADKICQSLSSIIQYLNPAFSKITVYGVEIKPYKSASDDVLVIERSIIYRSKETERKIADKITWNKEKLLDRVARYHSEIHQFLSDAFQRQRME